MILHFPSPMRGLKGIGLYRYGSRGAASGWTTARMGGICGSGSFTGSFGNQVHMLVNCHPVASYKPGWLFLLREGIAASR